MEQTTFQDETVIRLLNERYYFISFDGEQKQDVWFGRRRFKFKPTGRTAGTHELAAALGAVDGTVAYPTVVLLNPEYEIVFRHNAFLSGAALRSILETGAGFKL